MPPLLLLLRPMKITEEGTTCLSEAASAEAGEIVQLHKKCNIVPLPFSKRVVFMCLIEKLNNYRRKIGEMIY